MISTRPRSSITGCWARIEYRRPPGASRLVPSGSLPRRHVRSEREHSQLPNAELRGARRSESRPWCGAMFACPGFRGPSPPLESFEDCRNRAAAFIQPKNLSQVRHRRVANSLKGGTAPDSRQSPQRRRALGGRYPPVQLYDRILPKWNRSIER